MDPLTHAMLGATVAQVALGPRLGRKAWVLGALGGMLPDADILISSTSDPLLAIEYHRHFTHSFAFIPVGGLLAAAPWLIRKKNRADWRPILAATTLGYATHGLLDACTNYGTHLLWPFSDWRVAWHWITTVGPLLTLMLLVGLVFAVRGNRRLPAVIALLLGAGYVGAAAWQQSSAMAAQSAIAAARGHPVARGEMFPTVGNMLLWRSVYESGGRLHIDRIRVLGPQSTSWKSGYSVALMSEQGLPPAALADARVLRDYRRFSYFSAGWVAPATADASILGDARYSLRTDGYEPIWGIRLHLGAQLPELPVEWVNHTARNRVPVSELWRELTGTAPGYMALPVH